MIPQYETMRNYIFVDEFTAVFDYYYSWVDRDDGTFGLWKRCVGPQPPALPTP